MTTKSFKGVTWGHRRAIDPLIAASTVYAERTGVNVQWESRSLGAFEHEPLHVVSQSYDMVVFDHPFSGVVAASGCFVPLDTLPELADASRYVGRSLESYHYRGHIWGAPVDGASTHALYRPDLLEEWGGVPANWRDIIALGKRLATRGKSLAVAGASHHGLLAVASLYANVAGPWPTERRETFTIGRGPMRMALEAFRELLDVCPPESLQWNSIALHDAMAHRDDLVYCPIVFGFACECGPDKRLAFAPLPGIIQPYDRGAILGGAAVGLSSACDDRAEALRYVSFLLSPETQTEIFATNNGQPARIEAWENPPVSGGFGDFGRAVRSSVEGAVVRPRWVGYQQFEKRAGDLLQSLLEQNAPTHVVLDAIDREADIVRSGAIEEPYAALATA